MAYRRILHRAWAVAQQHKMLWLFGLLSSLSMRLRLDLGSDVLAPARSWIKAHVAGPSSRPAIVLLAVWLLVGLAFSLLRALGRSGLVDQVNAIEDDCAPTVRGTWGAILRYGGRVFGIALLLGLPTLVVMAVGWLPLIGPLFLCLLGPTGIDGFEFCNRVLAFSMPFGLLGVVLGELCGVIGALAERACILEDLSVRDSMGAGWALFRSQFQRTVLLWLVLLAVRITIFLALLIPVLLVVGVFSLPFRPLAESTPAAGILAYLSIGAFVWVLELAIGGVLAPFCSAYWTLAYRHLKGLRQESERVYARVDQSLPSCGPGLEFR